MLGDRFAARTNALNALRLALAAAVVVWHAHQLAGHPGLPWPVHQLLEQLPVDAFFAVSGFLIARSWQQRPDPAAFLLARAGRLLPGLWVCLAVTAFVIAPAAAWVAGGLPPSVDVRVGYVLGNAGVWVTQWGIDGPVGVPHPGSWNGSLWSLPWEGICYLAVLGIGLAGALRVKVVAGVAAGCWLFGAAAVTAGVPFSGIPIVAGPRCGLMFACGALAWLLRDRIPLDGRLASASAALLTVAAFTPNYRLIAAPAVVYLCLWTALTAGRWRWTHVKHDLSYGVYLYGFPLQQALLLTGAATGLGWAAFSVLSLVVTVPVAAASWFLVERPCQRRARRSRPRPARRATLPEGVLAEG